MCNSKLPFTDIFHHHPITKKRIKKKSWYLITNNIMSVIYFWSAKDPDTEYLSQWAYSPFEDKIEEKTISFVNMEQYMMWRKALLFEDYHMATKILNTTNPKEIKEYGRKVKNFDETKWKNKRQSVIYKGNMMKFQQNPDLQTKLIATGSALLAESSPYDRIYGIGFLEKDAEANKLNWGSNILGKTLVKVRESLQRNISI